jgi:hypothetical protein
LGRAQETFMRHITIVAFLFAAACAGQSGNSAEGIEGPGGKADGRSLPIGTYTNSAPLLGELASLTLKEDHTFTRGRDGACPGGGSCAPQTQTGVFLYTHSSDTSYLHFYGSDGSSLDRASWTLDSNTLTLTFDDSVDGPFTMTQDSSCEAAGGACVPPVPDACEFGSVADPGQYSCPGGQEAIECCLPPPVNNSCQQDTDCMGLLPKFVSECAGGTTAAAHWSCLANQCQITSCQ